MLLSRFSFADATSGLGIELYVVAACVIGLLSSKFREDSPKEIAAGA